MSNKLPVIFRVDSYGVTAVFPTKPADFNPSHMMCYAHFGQHGRCSLDWYRTTLPAKDYLQLYDELVQIGYYNLRVCKRISRKMDDERKNTILIWRQEMDDE